MNFSNNASIATLKLINERMDHLSNKIEDRTYDQLMELNGLGEMRQQLERETFIDYIVDGEQETSSVESIKRIGEARPKQFIDCSFVDPVEAKMTFRGVRLSLLASGVIDRESAHSFATLIAEENHAQCFSHAKSAQAA